MERKMSVSAHKNREIDPEYEGIEKDIHNINLEVKYYDNNEAMARHTLAVS